MIDSFRSIMQWLSMSDVPCYVPDEAVYCPLIRGIGYYLAQPRTFVAYGRY